MMRRNAILIIALAVVSFCCLAPLIVFIIPLKVFQAQERAAVPQFDVLDETVLAELKPPAGSMLLYQSSSGITSPTTTHGRELLARYNITGMSADEIIIYYQTILLDSGWASKESRWKTGPYYREDACIYFSVDELCASVVQVWITIWHDYYSQSFSPSVPWWFGWSDGDKTLSFWELLEMDHRIIRCPGE